MGGRTHPREVYGSKTLGKQQRLGLGWFKRLHQRLPEPLGQLPLGLTSAVTSEGYVETTYSTSTESQTSIWKSIGCKRKPQTQGLLKLVEYKFYHRIHKSCSWFELLQDLI